MNIKTCGDLHHYSMEYLSNEFGVIGQRLYDLARGIDERPVNPERIRKSISVEETYLQDLPDVQACFAALPELMVRLGPRIKGAGALSSIHTLFVKLKFNDFQRLVLEAEDSRSPSNR